MGIVFPLNAVDAVVADGQSLQLRSRMPAVTTPHVHPLAWQLLTSLSNISESLPGSQVVRATPSSPPAHLKRRVVVIFGD
jgi:hypothetical protein